MCPKSARTKQTQNKVTEGKTDKITKSKTNSNRVVPLISSFGGYHLKIKI